MTPLKKILLAEDDPKDVELTLAALAQLNLANEVHVCHDGVEVLEYLLETRLERGSPAVVLLDIKMPKLDGLQVLQRIRKEESLRGLPIVMLTSSREERDLVEGYRLGANAYVVKPVVFEEFVSTVTHMGLFWAVINEPPPMGGRPA
ncbi:MAG: response regulator [Candidatus Polarisedimenticolia bacterium]